MDEVTTVLREYVQQQTPRRPPAFARVEQRVRRREVRQRTGVVLAGVVVAASGVTVAALQPNGGEPVVTQPMRPGQTPGDRPTGPLPDGGAASCVEEYSAAAVATRAFAFDGTAVDVGPGTSNRDDMGELHLVAVTFAVDEWFRGGSAEEVTIDMVPPLEDSGDTYGVGSRLLVSGEPRWGGDALDDPIGWACGFTRYYDAETAAAWRTATR